MSIERFDSQNVYISYLKKLTQNIIQTNLSKTTDYVYNNLTRYMFG